MVYLALEPAAAREAIGLARAARCAVWVGSDSLTAGEFQTLVAEGVNVTRFSQPLAGATPDEVANAIAIIAEHHPGETVWVQHVAGI